MVPLLAIYPARSSCLLSIWKSFRQPINSRLLNGKLSAPLGTPPRNSGPVRSRDLRNEIKRRRVNKIVIISQGWIEEAPVWGKKSTLKRCVNKSIQKWSGWPEVNVKRKRVIGDVKEKWDYNCFGWWKWENEKMKRPVRRMETHGSKQQINNWKHRDGGGNVDDDCRGRTETAVEGDRCHGGFKMAAMAKEDQSPKRRITANTWMRSGN